MLNFLVSRLGPAPDGRTSRPARPIATSLPSQNLVSLLGIRVALVSRELNIGDKAMPVRMLRGGDGESWNVWDVTPDPRGMWELRKGDRRRGPSPYCRGPERRVNSDRRSGSTLAEGWRCFQSPNEKRGLTRMPLGWATMSDAELWGLLQEASKVRMRPSPVKESAGEHTAS